MKTTKRDLVQREAIIELLTDDEVSRVSTVESAVRLEEGDEFVDLDGLEQGVQVADGVLVHMGSVLPRKVVHAQSWGQIVELLKSRH